MLVALDAAEPQLVLELAERGELPNVRALLDDSLRAPIDNPVGFFVSSVWPSIVTALPTAEHGRFSGSQLRPGTYDIHRFTNAEVSGEPFWALLDRQGLRTAIVDVPHTEPVQLSNGLQVSGWGTHEGPRGARSWPVPVSAELVDRFGHHPVVIGCDRYVREHGVPELYGKLLDGVERKADLTEFILEQRGWDLFMVVFAESHCAGHVMWHLHDPHHPRHDPALVAQLGDPVINVYRALDAALGRVVAHAGDDTTLLLVLSHGMVANYQANFVLPRILSRLERSFGGSRRLDVHDFVIRAELSAARRARKRLGRAPSDRQQVKNRRRRFFALPNNDSTGAIRINLRGRDAAGTVHEGPEYEALCERLEQELTELVNLETGERLVRRVARTDDHHHGPARVRMPDLIVEWNRDAPICDIGSPAIGRITREDSRVRTGDHRPEGLLAVCAPSFTAQDADAIEGAQIGPLICALLGAEMPGRRLPGWYHARPITHQ
jgi:predicted AlkP superfamily phosphohydrolase/phosphomutase